MKGENSHRQALKCLYKKRTWRSQCCIRLLHLSVFIHRVVVSTVQQLQENFAKLPEEPSEKLRTYFQVCCVVFISGNILSCSENFARMPEEPSEKQDLFLGLLLTLWPCVQFEAKWTIYLGCEVDGETVVKARTLRISHRISQPGHCQGTTFAVARSLFVV